MIKLATKHHAFNCYEELFKEINTNDEYLVRKRYFHAIDFDLDILKDFIQNGYKDIHRTNRNGELCRCPSISFLKVSHMV